jgi:hypothetical protein
MTAHAPAAPAVDRSSLEWRVLSCLKCRCGVKTVAFWIRDQLPTEEELESHRRHLAGEAKPDERDLLEDRHRKWCEHGKLSPWSSGERPTFRSTPQPCGQCGRTIFRLQPKHSYEFFSLSDKPVPFGTIEVDIWAHRFRELREDELTEVLEGGLVRRRQDLHEYHRCPA